MRARLRARLRPRGARSLRSSSVIALLSLYTSAIGAHEVPQLARAMKEAGAACARSPGARDRARSPRRSCPRAPRRASSRAPFRNRPRTGSTRGRLSARSARWPDIGARMRRPQRLRTAHLANATATPEASALAPRERCDREVRVPARPRRAPGRAGRTRTPRDPRRTARTLPSATPDRAPPPPGPGARRALIAAPLPRARPPLTTRAPAPRAICAVASVEPSSATHTLAAGSPCAMPASVAPMRCASSRAATTTVVAPARIGRQRYLLSRSSEAISVRRNT